MPAVTAGAGGAERWTARADLLAACVVVTGGEGGGGGGGGGRGDDDIADDSLKFEAFVACTAAKCTNCGELLIPRGNDFCRFTAKPK